MWTAAGYMWETARSAATWGAKKLDALNDNYPTVYSNFRQGIHDKSSAIKIQNALDKILKKDSNAASEIDTVVGIINSTLAKHSLTVSMNEQRKKAIIAFKLILQNAQVGEDCYKILSLAMCKRIINISSSSRNFNKVTDNTFFDEYIVGFSEEDKPLIKNAIKSYKHAIVNIIQLFIVTNGVLTDSLKFESDANGRIASEIYSSMIALIQVETKKDGSMNHDAMSNAIITAMVSGLAKTSKIESPQPGTILIATSIATAGNKFSQIGDSLNASQQETWASTLSRAVFRAYTGGL